MALIGWTAWYATIGAYHDFPRGKCVVRQSHFVLSTDGATREAVLSTSFWLDTQRIHVSGCFQRKEGKFIVDRSGSLQTVFSRNGSLLCRIDHIAISEFDNAASQSLPSPHIGTGDEIDLRFRKLASNAWIVETADDNAGMCLIES
ncbi:hypothetical protein [Burkholderia mayonis]|uniref:Uncharacterized protein n=1 Tax=Burkholderia mayonis TaxID=1385591 RepID=A0A1B4G7J6_9BURK|nr:hypothetical protein WS71_22275 [Burkholderia mayonis]KVE58517.1 hypothetical protein WS71_24405 [Burkholderia mayonis]